MTATIAELIAQALQLSPEDRAHLADRLLNSLDTDRTVEDAWSRAVDRRMAGFESGSAHDIPIEDALARARAAVR
ncbi:MAG: hypothetical protein AD742_05280 [Methylibium sp. NZG]|nr:MAG: hypothetical protein AD742_05280 [Methylibium sp. NZG]